MPVDKPTPGNLLKTVDELVEAVNSGGSNVGKLCWFETVGSTFGTLKHPIWVPISDGVAPFTDAKVNLGDNSKIEIVTTGTYLFRLDIQASAGSADTLATLTVALNNDSIGPFYDLVDNVGIVTGNILRGLHIGCPIDLVSGDLIWPLITSSDAGDFVTAGVFTLIRIA